MKSKLPGKLSLVARETVREFNLLFSKAAAILVVLGIWRLGGGGDTKDVRIKIPVSSGLL
jgi:hypothetical protein